MIGEERFIEGRIDRWCFDRGYMLVKHNKRLRDKAIVSLCKEGSITQEKIGEIFNLSKNQIYKIYRKSRESK